MWIPGMQFNNFFLSCLMSEYKTHKTSPRPTLLLLLFNELKYHLDIFCGDA